jgi:acyl-lipid omega-6 desaturase (Delta-12 desaturase)
MIVKEDRRSNLEGALLLGPTVFSLLTLILTLDHTGPWYWVGQICGAVFFTQCFILIHEFGHNSFFRTKWINWVLGHAVGFVTIIPFYNWKQIHTLHHKWTGYRDKDPTTEGTVHPPKSLVSAIANFCWRFSLPVFMLGYRIGIYWNPNKLLRHLPLASYQKARRSMVIHLGLYAVTLTLFGAELLLVVPAYLLSLIVTELIILSQHSYIEMPLAGAKAVRPLPAPEQAKYTRRLDLPKWLAHFVLFNVNEHIAHHAEPSLPCYCLGERGQESATTLGVSTRIGTWIWNAKRTPATEYVFNTTSSPRF